eukprot:TRINITY_DN27352_c0_g1_i1.p1 TRINITY_DN27352_c0_g1~~TRINITY_DN27352_c0_g1_i1.p1  ORF type:complete len:465 (+),score=96.75 TRINITY_DN27352_c0_g1_i1:87-1481(+)
MAERHALTAGLAGWPPPSHRDAQGRQNRTGPTRLSEAQVEAFEQVLREMKDEMPFADSGKLSDEDTLLRAYVATGYKADEAVGKVRGSIAWRKAEDIEGIQGWCEEHLPADTTFRTHTDGLMGFYGVDNEGYPVWWERPNTKIYTEFVTTTPTADVDRWHYACVERLRELPKRLGVDRYTIVFDLKDVGTSFVFGKLGQVLRGQMSQDKLYYAENLRRFIIVNAPFGFSHTFAVIRKVLDPRTADKIVIGGRRSAGDQLSQHVAEEHIPTEFGGAANVDWDVHRMRPTALPDVFSSAPFWAARIKAAGERHLSTGADASGPMVSAERRKRRSTNRSFTSTRSRRNRSIASVSRYDSDGGDLYTCLTGPAFSSSEEGSPLAAAGVDLRAPDPPSRPAALAPPPLAPPLHISREQPGSPRASEDPNTVPTYSTHCCSIQEMNCCRRRGCRCVCCGERYVCQCCPVM